MIGSTTFAEYGNIPVPLSILLIAIVDGYGITIVPLGSDAQWS